MNVVEIQLFSGFGSKNAREVDHTRKPSIKHKSKQRLPATFHQLSVLWRAVVES